MIEAPILPLYWEEQEVFGKAVYTLRTGGRILAECLPKADRYVGILFNPTHLFQGLPGKDQLRIVGERSGTLEEVQAKLEEDVRALWGALHALMYTPKPTHDPSH